MICKRNKRHLPVDTRSRMISAEPMAGAASRAPSALISCTCCRPACSKKRRAMLWYLRGGRGKGK